MYTMTPHITHYKPFLIFLFPINPFSVPVKGPLANSVGSDETPQNAASDQSLHWLH